MLETSFAAALVHTHCSLMQNVRILIETCNASMFVCLQNYMRHNEPCNSTSACSVRPACAKHRFLGSSAARSPSLCWDKQGLNLTVLPVETSCYMCNHVGMIRIAHTTGNKCVKGRILLRPTQALQSCTCAVRGVPPHALALFCTNSELIVPYLLPKLVFGRKQVDREAAGPPPFGACRLRPRYALQASIESTLKLFE